MKEKYVLFFLIISNHLLSFYKAEDCPKETPIKYNGICDIKRCSREELENEICIISNEKVKIQWINNIIKNDDKEIEALTLTTSDQGIFISSYYYDEDNRNHILLIYNYNNNNKELILNEIITTNSFASLNCQELLSIKINNSLNNYLLLCNYYHCDLINFETKENQNFRVFDSSISIGGRTVTSYVDNPFFVLNDNHYFYGFIGKMSVIGIIIYY